jgi:hypothetical protein
VPAQPRADRAGQGPGGGYRSLARVPRRDALVRERRKAHDVLHYDTPSPEAIRKTAARNELPVDQITQLRVLDPYIYP